ncbi:MAG: glutamate racemase [Clostridiales bacterium]|nr:glutamate racemase [Clostridiales bacterium]
MDNRPIGVFDSGLGGLSAVRAILKLLPNEDIIYFGDTQRVPYGSRSEKTIEQYARQDIEFLEQFDCKLILAACGTVSSVAKNAAKCAKEPFIGVVSPAVKAAAEATKNGKIGVMGTWATINSGAYDREIKKYSPGYKTFGVCCPVLVSLVENNWIDDDDSITREIIKRYLAPLLSEGVDTIILGCTHFPHLAPIIQQEAGAGVSLIDTGREAVLEVKEILRRQKMENSAGHSGKIRYYISDKTQNFCMIAKTLLGVDISENVTFREISEKS